MTTLASPLPAQPTTAHELPQITTAQWQSVLGQRHLDGHGVVRDLAQALHGFLRAAHLGHAMAMNMAGRCHEQGWGTPVDAGKAVHCYRGGAEGGDVRGQFCDTGLLAARGREAEALQWLAQVPETATPRYSKQAGALLQAAFRALGEGMLALGEAGIHRQAGHHPVGR